MHYAMQGITQSTSEARNPSICAGSGASMSPLSVGYHLATRRADELCLSVCLCAVVPVDKSVLEN